MSRSPEDFRAWCAAYRRAGLSLGFVPTLGGLHAGHAALLDRARSECERVAASVYLNPTQFDSSEDLETYPAASDEDLAVCREAGVDLVWIGAPGDLLPGGFQTHVEVEKLTRPLCGAHRPGHFRGVTTVVTQLLALSRPHRAYFGLKDFQQARVVERLVRDLFLGVEVRTVATVREADGLALSSRNKRLDADERRTAPALYGALRAARERLLAGEDSADVLRSVLEGEIAREPRLRLEYAEVVDPATLEPFPAGRVRLEGGGALLAVAAYLGAARLIDSLHVSPVGQEAPARGE